MLSVKQIWSLSQIPIIASLRLCSPSVGAAIAVKHTRDDSVSVILAAYARSPSMFNVKTSIIPRVSPIFSITSRTWILVVLVLFSPATLWVHNNQVPHTTTLSPRGSFPQQPSTPVRKEPKRRIQAFRAQPKWSGSIEINIQHLKQCWGNTMCFYVYLNLQTKILVCLGLYLSLLFTNFAMHFDRSNVVVQEHITPDAGLPDPYGSLASLHAFPDHEYSAVPPHYVRTLVMAKLAFLQKSQPP